jgi:hypothetical protein
MQPMTSSSKVTDAAVADKMIFDILREVDADPPDHDEVSGSESAIQSDCSDDSDEEDQTDPDDGEHCSDLPPPLPYFQRTPTLPAGHENSQEKLHRSVSATSLVQAPADKNNLEKLRTMHMSKSLPNLRGCSRSVHNRGVGSTILDTANESSRDTGRDWALVRVAEFEQILGGL